MLLGMDCIQPAKGEYGDIYFTVMDKNSQKYYGAFYSLEEAIACLADVNSK